MIKVKMRKWKRTSKRGKRVKKEEKNIQKWKMKTKHWKTIEDEINSSHVTIKDESL